MWSLISLHHLKINRSKFWNWYPLHTYFVCTNDSILDTWTSWSQRHGFLLDSFLSDSYIEIFIHSEISWNIQPYFQIRRNSAFPLAHVTKPARRVTAIMPFHFSSYHKCFPNTELSYHSLAFNSIDGKSINTKFVSIAWDTNKMASLTSSCTC